MCDENSLYPRVETGYAYTEIMTKELVEKFYTQSFNQGNHLFQKLSITIEKI